MSFSLEKWYLDLVDDDGVAVIGYAARLHTGPLATRYASILHSPSAGAPTERTALRRIRPPEFHRGTLSWACVPLGLEGEWVAEAAPISRALFATEAGSIEWECLLPRARARIRLGGNAIAGYGYAERLRLTLPPGQLPFHRLRWGRHVSDRHSVVWIAWDGATTRHSVWLDGVEEPGARLTSSGVEGLPQGQSLRLSGSRTLRDRPVLGAVGEALPEFARHLAGPLGTMREHKRLDRSSLMAGGLTLDAGWCIPEEVMW